MGRVLVVDPRVAGVSGDMMLGALLELGAPEERLHMAAGALAELAGGEVEVRVGRVSRGGVRCTRVEVLTEHVFEDWGSMREVLEEACSRLGLGVKAREFASEVLEVLVKGELRVHGASSAPHELGSLDTLVDILGSAALLEALGLFDAKVLCAPVNTGSGVVETAHGTLGVPAPLVAEILRSRGIPFLSRHAGELATPTGVGLLACLVDEFTEELPVMRIERTGRGAGARELRGAPNMLQLHLCRAAGAGRGQVVLLETSVDDVSGEVVGGAVSRFLEAGALDVQVFQGITKKNRPSLLVQVVCAPGREEELAELMMRELGTLGVRSCRMSMRYMLERRVERVEVELMGRRFALQVKVARDSQGRVVVVKPEYEDLRRIAGVLSLPVREVHRLVCRELEV